MYCWLLAQGWDKTYCLQFVREDYDEIHFFGDKTFKVRGTRSRAPRAGRALIDAELSAAQSCALFSTRHLVACFW